MKNKNDIPIAKVSPRGNGSQNPKGSQIKKAGKIDKSSSPDIGPPQDGTKQPVNLSPEEIAARAYLHYENRASADEDHLEDWFRAEAELTAERGQA